MALIQLAMGCSAGWTNSKNKGVVAIANQPAIKLGTGELPSADG
ncbi:hypothetical protein BTM25_44670 [Actinomadura rubteroloni]|uniref:Uncharacterized protein n=1 Tax=Actinomadura rubteroloni TaxID=1926885 RepID=A0A2P4UE24_9ACTN|nr:hypothetical protein BTM25_44670 [Actinomadura rubteroloni]